METIEMIYKGVALDVILLSENQHGKLVLMKKENHRGLNEDMILVLNDKNEPKTNISTRILTQLLSSK